MKTFILLILPSRNNLAFASRAVFADSSMPYLVSYDPTSSLRATVRCLQEDLRLGIGNHGPRKQSELSKRNGN